MIEAANFIGFHLKGFETTVNISKTAYSEVSLVYSKHEKDLSDDLEECLDDEYTEYTLNGIICLSSQNLSPMLEIVGEMASKDDFKCVCLITDEFDTHNLTKMVRNVYYVAVFDFFDRINQP